MSGPQKLLILGAGHLAMDVADQIEDLPGLEVTGFVVSQPFYKPGDELLGKPVHSVEELAGFERSIHVVCVIGTTRRLDFIRQVESLGFQFETIIHPTARVSRLAHIAAGAVICAGAQVPAGVEIGRHVFVNRGALLGPLDILHECDCIAPGANLAANVTIGAQTWVGLGANILEGLTIGEGCLIGAGSLVTKNVPNHVKVVGAPAMIIEKDIQPY